MVQPKVMGNQRVQRSRHRGRTEYDALKSSMPDSDVKPEERCPINSTHGRLHQAHRLWHQVQAEYGNPEGFCTNLNAAIQALRTVTFVLQKEKQDVPNFDGWYDQWRARLRQDPVMQWLVTARNRIEKEGDLDTCSSARVSLLAGWNEPLPLVEFEIGRAHV